MRSPDERGFTLLEIVVALAVFSVAAMALLRLAGENTQGAAALERRALAQIVAENVAVETAVAATLDELPGSGEEAMADRRWVWRRVVLDTADPELKRVEIEVREGDAPQVLATLTLFETR